MFQLRHWPQAILHIDGDAFFASVLQATSPELKGKPLVVGRERGIATAFSYEAKYLGVTRGMPISQVQRQFPTCIVADSDYRLYELFCSKMLSILRTYSPVVEKYSIDEMFVDLKGLRRPFHTSYEGIAGRIKNHIESSLGISISVGVSLTKSLAKLASNSHKPSGLTAVPGPHIEKLLAMTKIQDVWGIGPNTSSYLQKLGITTALELAQKSENFVQKYLSKSFYEIWLELRGNKVYSVSVAKKETYQSISDTHTFVPTNDKEVLWARLNHHIEEAFCKARRFDYIVGTVSIFLKTQDFRYHTRDIKLLEKTGYPSAIRTEVRIAFNKLYHKNILYRTTGCTISDLVESTQVQQSLFVENQKQQEKMRKVYPLYERGFIRFGTSLYDTPHKSTKPLAIAPLSLQTIR